jgi:colanic acid biosynthesis protein WcaH
MRTVEWISDADWATIVENVPIVSVDLVVLGEENEVLLGRRENEPAKGEWFVPGGRVRKGETLEDAVHRVAADELGVDVEIVERLGAYEHFYDTADVPDVGGKQYIAHGFVVRPDSLDVATDDQHSAMKLFSTPPSDLHEYPAAYLADSELFELSVPHD